MIALTPLDGFSSLAMWGVLALALIVLAARVAWAVWRSLRDERALPEHVLIHDAPQNVRLVERWPYRHDLEDTPYQPGPLVRYCHFHKFAHPFDGVADGYVCHRANAEAAFPIR